MIKSMTGYGSAKGTVEGLTISVELKSVNMCSCPWIPPRRAI